MGEQGQGTLARVKLSEQTTPRSLDKQQKNHQRIEHGFEYLIELETLNTWVLHKIVRLFSTFTLYSNNNKTNQ